MQVPQVHQGTKVDSSGNSAKPDSKTGKNKTNQKATENHNQPTKPQTNKPTPKHTHTTIETIMKILSIGMFLTKPS